MSSLRSCSLISSRGHVVFLRQITALLAALAIITLSACSGTASIQDAAADDDLETVHTLIQNNPALVSSTDKSGWTPLHWAAFEGNTDVAELLLNSKAEVGARDQNGATPLHLAAAAGNKDVALMLLSRNADVNAKTKNGQTPLAVAIAKGRTDVADVLRQQGGKE